MTAKVLKHKFVNAIADGADATIVRPSNWNDDHDMWLGYRSVTSTTDAISNADHLTLVNYNSASPVAVSMAAPSGGNMPLGWQARLRNVGSGIVTVTGSGGATFNGAGSITLVNGDMVEIFSIGTAAYIAVIFQAPITGGLRVGGRLRRTSTTTLEFAPYEGAFIKLNKVLRPILATGIAGMGNTGVYVNGTAGQNLAANTTYLVFCFDNAGVLTADFRTDSTHGISQTAGNEGVEVKFISTTEDATRSLIGMVRTNASSQFVDTLAQRFVRSWMNDANVKLYVVMPSGVATASATWVELGAGAVRNEWVNWAGETVDLDFTCPVFSTSSVVATIMTSVAMDGVAPINGALGYRNTYADNKAADQTARTFVTPSEGYHYACPIGQVLEAVSVTWHVPGAGPAPAFIGAISRK